jgi:hypothetical protein
MSARKRLWTALSAAAAIALLAAAPASAEFGLSEVDVSFTDSEGSPVTQAGAHPFAMTTSFEVNSTEVEGIQKVDGALRDLKVTLPPGFAGNPTAVPTCETVEFLDKSCPAASALGTLEVRAAAGLGIIAEENVPVYNLLPAPGVAQKQGFIIQDVPVTVNATVSPAPPYNVIASLSNTSQVLEVFSSELTLWGVPADPDHDALRGPCLNHDGTSNGKCSAGVEAKPFITLPRSCAGPLATRFEATSWWSGDPESPGPPVSFKDTATSPAMDGCASLGLAASISAAPTTRAAQSATGLDFGLTVTDPGLTSPTGTAGSDIRETVVTLPEGMSINPSQAEGLEVCSEDQLGRESAGSEPGEGCPQASKVGSIEVETPLLENRTLHGDLFVAEPYANPFGSLIAVYVTIREPRLGIFVSQALEVEPDPETGRLTTTASEMPQLPFSRFRLRFRQGARAPLISPPGCGRFRTEALLRPSAGGPPSEPGSSFELISGPNGAPCPSGAAPFAPGFEAGTLNNFAGSYSPFAMRITRADGMQDLSNFSAVLPPGVLGKIAGVPWCPEAGIAQARSRTGERGGGRELADPSCPAASAIGRTLAGAGVGSALTYVGGSLYLAGPYKGAPLSVVSITPAVAGPFDAGAVVVRVGLNLNPVSGAVEADGAASDEIPHILQGIPLSLRDLHIYTDRPAFTLNATSCEEASTFATLWGAGTVLDPAAPFPVGRAARYQAAGCGALGFEPRLGVKLKGKTRRGGFPALRAHYRPRAGDANLRRLALTFPSSAFVEQGHFRTICTRVQFAAGPGHGALCPAGSVYGRARVWTPLLDGPLSGPVILRSSDNNLPDAVFVLRGPASAPVKIEVAVRIDSVKGRLRATVQSAPDAPVSRAIVDMRGGQKGLFVNSRNLCRKAKRNRARVNLRGQNGKLSRMRPVVRAVGCQKGKKEKRRARQAHRRAKGGGR